MPEEVLRTPKHDGRKEDEEAYDAEIRLLMPSPRTGHYGDHEGCHSESQRLRSDEELHADRIDPGHEEQDRQADEDDTHRGVGEAHRPLEKWETASLRLCEGGEERDPADLDEGEPEKEARSPPHPFARRPHPEEVHQRQSGEGDEQSCLKEERSDGQAGSL